MKKTQQIADELKLQDYFSEDSLAKLLSDETQKKAAQITSAKDVLNLLKELDLPELNQDPSVFIDDGACLEMDELDAVISGRDMDTHALHAKVRDFEAQRFSPKAPGGQSVSSNASTGAALGGMVGAALAGGAGAAGVIVGAPVAAAVGAAILVGAAAGAAGAAISTAVR
jgi:hypothetical protein